MKYLDHPLQVKPFPLAWIFRPNLNAYLAPVSQDANQQITCPDDHQAVTEILTFVSALDNLGVPIGKKKCEGFVSRTLKLFIWNAHWRHFTLEIGQRSTGADARGILSAKGI